MEGVDDLVFFRDIIAWEDTLGTVHRNYGEVLHEEDPRHLYIGVDSYGEAEDMFLDWVAPESDVRKAGGEWQYHMTDADGKAQGIVTLAPSADPDHVAEVTASGGVDFGVFDRITSLKKDACLF